MIDSRITDERLGEPEMVSRLATTWLNPSTAPALELIDCSHERWEVETHPIQPTITHDLSVYPGRANYTQQSKWIRSLQVTERKENF